MTTKCPNCASTIPEGATLCPECGYDNSTTWPPLAEELPDMPTTYPDPDNDSKNAGLFGAIGLLKVLIVLAGAMRSLSALLIGTVIALIWIAYQWNRSRDLARGCLVGLLCFYGAVALICLGIFAICSNMLSHR